ncbi:MAG: pilus assembly protein PilM [Gammaproteobacteria bacterium]
MSSGGDWGDRRLPNGSIRRRLALYQLFKRKKGRDALTAVTFADDGIGIAAIHTDPTLGPQLLACEFHSHDGSDAAQALRETLSATGSAHARCTTLMNAGDYQLLLVEAPDVEASELRAAIRWRIKDLIDFHIDDAVIDVVEIPGQDRGRARMMYVVAARSTRVRARIDQIEDAGLELAAIDVEELALRNLAALADRDGRGTCLVWFGGDDGLILLVREGELYLSRRIEVGTSQLFSAALHGDPDNGELGDPLTGVLDQVILEIQRSLDYYDSHFSLPPLTMVHVAPCAPAMPYVARYLDLNLNLSAVELDLARLFPGASVPDAVTQARCLTAVGAALRVDEVAL